jgi:hypothetical protein
MVNFMFKKCDKNKIKTNFFKNVALNATFQSPKS